MIFNCLGPGEHIQQLFFNINSILPTLTGTYWERQTFHGVCEMSREMSRIMCKTSVLVLHRMRAREVAREVADYASTGRHARTAVVEYYSCSVGHL